MARLSELKAKRSQVISASSSLVSGYRYMVDTGSITLTLPASPTVGTEIEICDGGADFSVSPVTIDRNGSNIGGLAANATLNTSNDRFMLIYMNGTYGWGMF